MVSKIVALTALLVVLPPVNHGFVCGNWWYPRVWRYPYIGEMYGGRMHHYPLAAVATGSLSSSSSSAGDGIGDAASSAATSRDAVYSYSGVHGRYKCPEVVHNAKHLSGHTVKLHESHDEHATIIDESTGVSSTSSSAAAVEVVGSTGTDGDAGSSSASSSSADSESGGTSSNTSSSSSATVSSEVVASDNGSVPEEADERPGCFGFWGYDSVYGHAGILPAAEATGSSSSSLSSSAASGVNSVDGGSSSSSSSSPSSSSSSTAGVSESTHPSYGKKYGGYGYPGYFGHWGYSGIYRHPSHPGPAGVFGRSSSSSSAGDAEDGADAAASSSSPYSATADCKVPAPWRHGPPGPRGFLWPYGYWKYPLIGTGVAASRAAGTLGSFEGW